MEVPSIVLKQAPDSCNIYVISTNKLIINSRNPILRTGMLIILSFGQLTDFFFPSNFYHFALSQRGNMILMQSVKNTSVSLLPPQRPKI